MNLNESIRHLDLEECVYPFISIDEFEPKVGVEKDIVVIAFYCTEELVAKDLQQFLSKSYVDVIDVDASPNPDHKGRYLVFVELHREPAMFHKFMDLVKEVERLSGKMDWQVKPYLVDQAFSIQDDSWKKAVAFEPEQYMTKDEFEMELKNALGDFFERANVSRIQVEEGKLTISNIYTTLSFPLEGIVDEAAAIKIMEQSEHDSYRTTEIVRLDEMLHCAYPIYQTKDKIFVQNQNKVLILGKYH